MAKRVRIEDRVETRTGEIGKDLYERLTPRSPSIFHGRWWEDRLINWAMEDDAVRVQMLRFVDVLSSLQDHTAIASHLEGYFHDVRQHLPWAARIGLDLSTNNSILSRALAYNARTNSARIARRFIAGESPAETLACVRQIRRDGFAFSLEQLDSSVVSEVEADRFQRSYLDLIEEMSERVDDWPSSPILDQDATGAIPRLHITVKLSALDSQFRAIDPVGSRKRVIARLRPILRAAQQHHVFVQFGMEKHKDRILAFDICKRILMEKEFRDFADTGINLQAYLETAEGDLKSLLAWTKKRGTPITVRLEKGAFWDYEIATSDYRNWPAQVRRRKWQTDESFERQSRFLMKNHKWLRPALATHNIRSLAHGLAWAEEHKVADQSFEIQLRYGIGEEPGQLFTERGYRVRLQTPFGSLIPGVGRLARHLLENTSNDSFLRHSFTRPVAVETHLMKPSDHAAEASTVEEDAVPSFVNEPHTDFNIEENRSAMQQAITDVRDEFGQTYPLVIDGKSSESRSTLSSRNPSSTKEIVGHVAAASADQSADAVDAAQRTFPQWAAMETSNRCEYVELIAAEIRERRFELAAWVCLEVGKSWADADREVAEAIDFCMYYASEMRRLDVPQTTDFKGEDNSYSYRPRGVAVVISPWNSPLAALTGMTAAAVVAGNTVVMKPAEQASVIAAKLMDVIRNAGVPDGVVNFLPGIGEDIGPELTGSPDVDIVCFTGSQEVGLEINRTASETDHRQSSVRRVIAEMSGKNAIIVDEDADLDEAVPGVMHSAFGYAGQKCSACSRVIVLDRVHDRFVERLVEATKSLQVGVADDPGTAVGPVIDEDAQKRIQKSLKSVDAEIGEEIVLAMDVKKVAKVGSFVGPTIVTGVDAESNLSQEELLGPVLCVIKVRNLDDAFSAANCTRFALTGGVYSRNPTTLKRARNEFHVGNLFLNREITGTVVQRQPFGGYRMSGVGSKAGGPDYLLQFLIPISVTENTSRRGYDKKTARARS